MVVLLFGAPKLPGLARSIGQSMRIFRSEVKTMKDEATTDVVDEADAEADAPAHTKPATTKAAEKHHRGEDIAPWPPRTGRWRNKSDERMSLGEHLREFRKRLVFSAIAILVGAVLGFFLAPFVIDALRVPINEIAEQRNATIVYTTVTGAFDLRIAISVTIAIVIASPVWLYQIFAFLVPGLTTREKRYTFGFFFSAVPLFFSRVRPRAGLCFRTWCSFSRRSRRKRRPRTWTRAPTTTSS